MNDRPCPFCHLAPERVVIDGTHARVITDAFPVSPGHLLVVAKRHVGSFFALEPDEQAEVIALKSTLCARMPGVMKLR